MAKKEYRNLCKKKKRRVRESWERKMEEITEKQVRAVVRREKRRSKKTKQGLKWRNGKGSSRDYWEKYSGK